MQIKIYNIPIGDTGAFTDELNAFLRGNKILEIEQHLVSNPNGAYWSFCVKYLDRNTSSNQKNRSNSKKRVDYKAILDEVTFKKFSTLKATRKERAIKDAVPAYMIFTDEELATIAQLEELTPKRMLSIKGIGQKKVEKYGAAMIEALSKNEKE